MFNWGGGGGGGGGQLPVFSLRGVQLHRLQWGGNANIETGVLPYAGQISSWFTHSFHIYYWGAPTLWNVETFSRMFGSFGLIVVTFPIVSLDFTLIVNTFFKTV